MRFRATVGEIVQQGAGGAAGIVGAQLFQHGPLKSFHQFPVGLFALHPVQGQTKQSVHRFKVCIGLRRLLDRLGKVGGGQDPGVGLAQAGAGVDDAGFPEMVEGGPARRFPTDLTLMKEVEMPPHRAARLGCALGQGPDDPVLTGQPDGQQAGFPLAAQMEQNSFILKRLAQVPTLADGAKREDKRDDSAGGNV